MTLCDSRERDWLARGFAAVAGVDEVGRGPWAGPVVAAAVIVPADDTVRRYLLARAGDSKKLSEARRDEVDAYVRERCTWAIGEASVTEIDTLSIRGATLLAMQRAVAAIGADAVVVDGRDVPQGLTGEAVVKGDGVELCVSCASVVAKVYRDALMAKLAKDFPHYGWERNAGYGVPLHIEGLRLHGVSIHHRMSFAPVRDFARKVA